MPDEDKPLKKTYFDRNLQKYCITFSEHGDFYDFYNSQEIISEFLTVFENNFVARPNTIRLGKPQTSINGCNF